MRKVFWCGCAGMLAAAVCVYLSAKCAKQYPDSLVAQSGKLAWRVCTDWNPAVQLGRHVGASTVGYLHPSMPERSCAGVTVACAQPADPGPGVVPPSVIEVIDLSGFQAAPVYPLDHQLVQIEARSMDPITVLPGEIEEAEAPAEMPPAEDEVQEPKPSAFDRFRNLVEEAQYELLPMPQAEEIDAEVEAVFEKLPVPQEGEPVDAVPEESELRPEGQMDGDGPDCKETDYHQRYPECPYGGGCPGMYKSK